MHTLKTQNIDTQKIEAQKNKHSHSLPNPELHKGINYKQTK